MYLSGSQVRRERTGRHAPSKKEGPSMRRKKKTKGASIVDRKEERLLDERKKVPLDEMKKEVYPYGKRGRPTLLLLEPTPDQASRSPTSITMVPRDTTSSLELDLHIRKWRIQTLRVVNNRANSGAME
jgi:hypothetical protein